MAQRAIERGKHLSKIKHEAFVYIWYNDADEQYVGFHIGSHEDGYTCSSDEVKERIKSEPDWRREILAWGTAREMQAFETGWLRAVDARRNTRFLNRWNNEIYYTESGVPDDHKRDFYEGILTKAGLQPGKGSNKSDFYVVYIDDQMVNCNPEWVSEKDDARIQRQIGKRVGCTVTWKGNYAYFSPANLNEME